MDRARTALIASAMMLIGFIGALFLAFKGRK